MTAVRFLDRWLMRTRFVWILGAVALISYLKWSSTNIGDWWVFEFAARDLGHLHGYTPANGPSLQLYALNPDIQIGPPAVLAAVPAVLIHPPHHGRALMAIAMVVWLAPMLYLVERLAVTWNPVRRWDLRRTTLIGGLLLAPGWRELAVHYMHLDDVMVLSLVLLVMFEVTRGRAWIAGLALGTAVATKPWAIGFVALLFILPLARARVAVAIAGVAGLLWWLPFLIAAPTGTVQALTSLATPVNATSLFGLLGLAVAFPFARPMQLAVMTYGGFRAGRVRRWAALPLLVIAIRLATDWQVWSYYAAGLVFAALMYDLIDGRDVVPWTAVAAAVMSWAPLELTGFVPNTLVALLRLALIGVTVWLAVRRAPLPLTITGTEGLPQRAAQWAAPVSGRRWGLAPTGHASQGHRAP